MFAVGPAHPISPDFDPDLTGTSIASSALSAWRYGTVAEFASDWGVSSRLASHRLDLMRERGEARVFDAVPSGCYEWIVLTGGRR